MFIVGNGSQWKYTTDIQKESGNCVGWALDICGRISIQELKLGMLTLCVKTRDTLIGRAAVDLENVLTNMDRWVDIRGDVVDRKRKSTGQYRLCIRYIRIECKV